VFDPGKHFQPNPMFGIKAGSTYQKKKERMKERKKIRKKEIEDP
jgi:hypothetical protein